MVKKGLLAKGFNPLFYFGKTIDPSEYRCPNVAGSALSETVRN
jgi:hypothetical protein